MQITCFLATIAVALLLQSAQGHHEGDDCKCHLPAKITGKVSDKGHFTGTFYFDLENKLYIWNITVVNKPTHHVILHDYGKNKTLLDRLDQDDNECVQIPVAEQTVPYPKVCVPKAGSSGLVVYAVDATAAATCTPSKITVKREENNILMVAHGYVLENIQAATDSHLGGFAKLVTECTDKMPDYVVG